MSKLLEFISYHDLTNWSVNQYLDSSFSSKYNIVLLKKYIKEEKEKIKPFEFPDKKFGILGVSNKIGLFDNEIKRGKEINQTYKKVKNGFLAYNPYRINVGSIGLKTDLQNFDLISPAYVVFSCKKDLLPEYLYLIFKTQTFNNIIKKSTRGSVRQILAFDILENLKIPLPPLEKQREIVEAYQSKVDLANRQEQEAKNKEKEIEEYLYRELGIIETNKINNKLLEIVNFKELTSWSYRDNVGNLKIKSSKYDVVKFSQKRDLYIGVFRGKSPKYAKSKYTILNQKCIRWNDIEIEHSKSVQEKWYKKIDNKFFTRKGDILINSTGDGTIGRSAMVTEKFENLMYDSHILLLRVDKNTINPFFLVEYINSTLGQQQIENIKSAVATKQTELGIGNLKNIQFVLPHIETQTKLANHISHLKKQIEELKKQAQRNRILALQEFEKEIFNEA